MWWKEADFFLVPQTQCEEATDPSGGAEGNVIGEEHSNWRLDQMGRGQLHKNWLKEIH